MRTIENPEEFRANIRVKLQVEFGIIEEEDNDAAIIALNLEKGIYNYAIKQATDRNIVKKWDNPYFTHLYIDRLRTIFCNLKNPDLKARVLNKSIKPHELAFMTHQEMSPEKWQKLIDDKKIRDENKYAPKLEASTDNFTCRKCKSKECSYYQLQTRSADEPMTTFVTCIKCGNRWKC
jgi:transcription elongation factor S-II